MIGHIIYNFILGTGLLLLIATVADVTEYFQQKKATQLIGALMCIGSVLLWSVLTALCSK